MFAEKDQEITAYSYNPESMEYVGDFPYFWMEGTGLAANSTNVSPPTNKAGFTIVFNKEFRDWEYVTDKRGAIVYSTANKTESDVNYLGEIKEGFTEIKPTSVFDIWNGTEWVDPRTAEEIAAYKRSLFQKLSKRQFALYMYDHQMYDQVMQAIEANPRLKIEYDAVSDIERLSPTVSEMTSLLGWTDAQVDQMWAEALTL